MYARCDLANGRASGVTPQPISAKSEFRFDHIMQAGATNWDGP
jgi:hypothetical protein